MFVEEANTLEKFILAARQKSLWIAAYTVFGACLAFVASSFLELPEKYLTHQQFAESLTDLEDEQTRRSRVIELYEKSIKDLGPLLQFYADNIEAGGADTRRNSVSLRSIADRTSARLRADISESEGILLQGDTYQKLHLRLLTGSKLALELSEAVHASSASLSSRTVRRTLSDKYEQVMLANKGIAGSVIPAFSAQTIVERHALEKKTGELAALNRQSWLAACAMLYLILFTVFCIAKYFGYRGNVRAADI
jgi:hypothetical protein